MTFQEEIHRKTRSDKLEERKVALELLRNNFIHLPDKKQAWEDIIFFSQDKHYDVRWRAADAIVTTFSGSVLQIMTFIYFQSQNIFHVWIKFRKPDMFK